MAVRILSPETLLTLTKGSTIETTPDGAVGITEKATAVAEDHLRGVRDLFGFLRQNFKDVSIQRDISYTDLTQFRQAVRTGYLFAQHISKKHSLLFSKQQKKELLAESLALKLSLHSDPKAFENTEFTQFVRTNALHHAFHEIRHIVSVDDTKSPILTFVGEDGIATHAVWNEIEKIKTDSGYILQSESGKILCETDTKFMLKKDWVVTYRGIEKDPTDRLLPMAKRVLGDELPEFYVKVRVSISKQQVGVGGFSGQHTFLEIGNRDHIYTIGKYPLHSFTSGEIACATSRKVGRWMVPDIYAYYDKETRDEASLAVGIPQEKFDEIFTALSREKQEASFFSLLDSNCTGHAVDFFKKELGIELQSKISVGQYVWQLVPGHIRAPFIAIDRAARQILPSFVRSVISVVFYPFYYVYSLAIGIVGLLMSMGNHQGIFGQDVTIWKVLTNSLSVSHPVALKDFLRREYPTGIIFKDG